jgi:hypothetical protein
MRRRSLLWALLRERGLLQGHLGFYARRGKHKVRKLVHIRANIIWNPWICYEVCDPLIFGGRIRFNLTAKVIQKDTHNTYLFMLCGRACNLCCVHIYMIVTQGFYVG